MEGESAGGKDERSISTSPLPRSGSRGDLYSPAAQTASELTDNMTEFLDNTESEYISDNEDEMELETIEELQAALKNRMGQVNNLRKQLQTAKGLLSRTKQSNK